jgi:hypothetical protein
MSVLKSSIRPSPGNSILMQAVPREESNLRFRRKIPATVAEQTQIGTASESNDREHRDQQYENARHYADGGELQSINQLSTLGRGLINNT